MPTSNNDWDRERFTYPGVVIKSPPKEKDTGKDESRKKEPDEK